jgi:hypothetical protein
MNSVKPHRQIFVRPRQIQIFFKTEENDTKHNDTKLYKVMEHYLLICDGVKLFRKEMPQMLMMSI